MKRVLPRFQLYTLQSWGRNQWFRSKKIAITRNRITRLKQYKKTKIDVRVMCCLPSHAFPVLCPSDLLSPTPSACQLTTDGHVSTPSTSNQIIWWLHWSQSHRPLDTLVLQHKRSWQGDPAGCLSYQLTGNNWQRMWATLAFTQLSIILQQLVISILV